MNEISFFNNAINNKLLELHTGYLGKVLSVSGNTAMIQPLTLYKAIGGVAQKKSPVSAVIPSNIKCTEQTITTENGDITVLVPASLVVGDIVYVGVCERDISNARNGIIATATNRHHNINDGVILKVL